MSLNIYAAKAAYGIKIIVNQIGGNRYEYESVDTPCLRFVDCYRGKLPAKERNGPAIWNGKKRESWRTKKSNGGLFAKDGTDLQEGGGKPRRNDLRVE